jgi:lipopolysaccharide export system permease protein
VSLLQRYVMDQVCRVFCLMALTLSAIFVLSIVGWEAAREGLAPQDIGRILPFLVPRSLPYTVPVSALFAVTVVYGRLASDNEIIAVKAAGLSAIAVIKPVLWLSLFISATLWILSIGAIPSSNAQFKSILYSSLEDLFYKMLKKERQFDRPDWPFFIRVKDVEDQVLIEPTFKHRSRENPKTYDLQVVAKRASIRFIRDSEPARVRVVLEDSETWGGDEQPFLFVINGRKVLEYPIPQKVETPAPRVEDLTDRQIVDSLVENRYKLTHERKRQAIAAALWVGSGRIKRVPWPQMREVNMKYIDWKRRVAQLETERQLRGALALGPFCFVLLGAPVGILFARRDFLSAFITCFLPIALLYYPLVLAGVNLGKELILPPWSVWGGNLVLCLLAMGLALPPIRRN